MWWMSTKLLQLPIMSRSVKTIGFWTVILSFVSECKCNTDNSASLQCDANGNCTCKDGFGGEQCDVCKEEGFTGSKCDECKPNIIGGKCDACQPNYFNYPSCQGKFSMYDQIFFFWKENVLFCNPSKPINNVYHF